MHTIEKHSGAFGGAKFRMQIKGFKYADDMHKFLNRQCDNQWKISTKDFKPGTYLHAGGQWHNVKHLDADTLCHI